MNRRTQPLVSVGVVVVHHVPNDHAQTWIRQFGTEEDNGAVGRAPGGAGGVRPPSDSIGPGKEE